MKINSQFTILIAGILCLPLLCMLVLPVYMYMTSSQRYLMQNYNEMRNVNLQNLSDNDWNEMKKHLENTPPNTQILIYYNDTAIISNMKEIKNGSRLTSDNLFDFVRSTSGIFDYQFRAICFESNDSTGRDNNKALVVSRYPIGGNKTKHKLPFFFLPMFLCLIAFEAFTVIIVIKISKSISASIQDLEKSMQKIADGELDTKIDIPKKGRRSNEITSLMENLERMRVSLKDNQERRTKFIMGISHDLRTPIALIKGYTEAITDGVVSDMDSIKKALYIIHSKTDQFENMINDLINYVKLSSTDWRKTLEPTSLEAVMNDYAKSLGLTADVYNRGIFTEVKIDPELKIPLDRNLFNRMLENLFSNALRYTKEGDSITVSGVQTKDDVRITVADTGCGIARRDLDHIYDLFYRGTSSRREKGFGIGLSVVKTIVDTMDWKIQVDSEEGEGTVFTIIIPLSQQNEKKALVQPV